jgi:general secretion pathway protein N
MTMRGPALLAFGALAYGIFLVWEMPASFVAARLERESRGALRLFEARGSAWRGEARALFVTPAGEMPIEQLQWRLNPASLAAGRLGFTLQVNDPGVKAAGELARGVDAWQAHDVTLQGPASTLTPFMPVLATWRPGGEVTLRAKRLAWTPSSIHGDGQVEWRFASVILSEVKPLGHYRVEVRGEGAQARIILSTLEGPLRLSGNGTVTPAGRVSFRGEARAEGPQAAALQPLLDLLGPRRPDGSREIVVR